VACRIPVQRVAAYAASNDIRRLAGPLAEKDERTANNRTTQIATTRLQWNRPSSKQVARALPDMARPIDLTRPVKSSSCSQLMLKLTMDQRPTDVFRGACSARDGLKRRSICWIQAALPQPQKHVSGKATANRRMYPRPSASKYKRSD
jgi:hypothetical protein